MELETVYTYNNLNRLETVTQNGKTITYTYDQANMLTSQTNRAGENILGQYAVSYYLDGNKASIAEINKPITSYLYDDMGRMIQEIVVAGVKRTVRDC